MIVLLIVLWSICAVYITHILEKRKMHAAAIAFTVLFCYLLVWTYLIFILDILNFGFDLGKLALLHGSKVFLSFIRARDLLYQAPSWVLVNLFFLCVVFVVTVAAYFAVSSVRIYREIRKRCAGNAFVFIRKKALHITRLRNRAYIPRGRIYLRHCRLNN